jgi:hypothetical protein
MLDFFFFVFLVIPFRVGVLWTGFGLSFELPDVNVSTRIQSFSELRCNKYFVMYFTEMIQNYSRYSLQINQFYGAAHNIGMILIDETDDASFDKEDVRWNKVKIIYNLMSNESHSFIEYFIWLDSDLFFVDFNYNFSELLLNYSSYDVIISKEINPLNGIANTGSIIVRNSPWSKKFFHSWWYDYDHNSMDQHAFEVLYRSYDVATVASRVKLLYENDINSEFPGLWTFQNGLPVLHLAGESNFVREEILKTAWTNFRLCNLSSSGVCKESIITREELNSIDYIPLHFREWESILQTLQALSLKEPLLLEDVVRVRYRAREAQQSINKYSLKLFDKSVNEVLLRSYTLTAARMIYGLSSQLILSTSDVSQTLIVPQLQNFLDSGMELAVVESDETSYTQLLAEMKVLEVHLKSLIAEKDKKVASYYLFKIFEFEAHFHQKHQLFERSLESYQQALKLWFDLAVTHSYFGSGNSLLSSFEEGINILKNLLLLSCFNGIRKPKVDAIDLSFRGLCILLRLASKNQGVAVLPTESLVDCSLENSSFDRTSIFLHRLLSNFSSLPLLLQSEFIEIFLLSVHCPLFLPEYHEQWQQVLGNDFNRMYLSSLESYFAVANRDVVNSSIEKIFFNSPNRKGKRFRKKKWLSSSLSV